MKKHQRANGRAIKWIDTRYGNKHKARLFIWHLMASGMSQQAAHMVWHMQCGPAKTPVEKINRACAIASAIIDCHASIYRTMPRR